jgi:hypothetical protein
MSTTLSRSPFAIKLDCPPQNLIHLLPTMSLPATLGQLHARISKLESRSRISELESRWLGINPDLTTQLLPQSSQTHHRLGVNPDSSNQPDPNFTSLMQRLYNIGMRSSESHWEFLSMENGVIRGMGQTSDGTRETFSIRSQWFPRVRRRGDNSNNTSTEEVLIITLFTSRGPVDGLDYTPEGIIHTLNEIY